MAVFQEPTQWDHELGNNADVSSLPDDTSATTGVASLQKLFQIINQTPLEAGGVAPEREDINALFKILGDSVFYAMNGGLASYNPAYDYVVGRYVVYNNTLYKCIQANGPSSLVVDPTHGTHWIKIIDGQDLNNYANVDLSNLSATGQAKIEGFAEKDLSNITQDGKNTAISWLMPDLTSQIQVSAPYTAPSDGWLYIYLSCTSNGGYLLINGDYVFLHDIYGNTNVDSTGFVPVSKGDVITTTATNSAFSLYFMRCKGAN